ncbi:MAG: hypothetical protein QME60_01385 [Verrucomicrobiota bacterium]|nr:hypothetical protein [Verrucomicrobiota bacterium]
MVDDPTFFIESFFFILDKDSKKVPFRVNGAQRKYLAERSRRDIILKARKMGFSSLIIALWLHACITQENRRAVIVSHEAESTERLLQRAIYMLDNAAVKINWRRRGDTLLFSDTGSWLYIGTAGARAFGRGDDITHGHLSEPAFYEKLDVVSGVQEALINNSYFVLESTANGAGTPYHEIWKAAENGESNIKPHFHAWWKDPGYRIAGAQPVELTEWEKKYQRQFNLDWGQLAWWRDKLRNMVDPKLFPQEYPAYPDEAFLASGRMVFDWEAVKIHEDNAPTPKWVGRLDDVAGEYRFVPDDNGGKPHKMAEMFGKLVVWETPAVTGTYLVTIDASTGTPGLDRSVADVWDLRSGRQVAQWVGYRPTDAFAEQLAYRIGAYYNWALIFVENKYPGNAVEVALRGALAYPNLMRDPGKPTAQETGFKTTEPLKATMVSDAQRMLRELDIKVASKYTLAELKTFVVTQDGKLEATTGCYDDTITTLMAACYAMRRTFVPEEGIVTVNRGRKSIEDHRGHKHLSPKPSGASGGVV